MAVGAVNDGAGVADCEVRVAAALVPLEGLGASSREDRPVGLLALLEDLQPNTVLNNPQAVVGVVVVVGAGVVVVVVEAAPLVAELLGGWLAFVAVPPSAGSRARI